MSHVSRTLTVLCGLLLQLAILSGAVGCRQLSPALSDVSNNPEPATAALSQAGIGYRKQFTGREFVAVTAHPLASDAAYRVLDKGGSALDAAIAAQMVLGLVEPQSSGIGGGGFLLYWDAGQRKLFAFDGRETAPAAASERLFLDERGEPLSFAEAIVGGRSVGVPGLLRMLELAHQQHGRLAWQYLFGDAIALAENGFAVSPRLHSLVAQVPLLDQRIALDNYLHVDARPLPEGHWLTNPDYANSLRRIASEGADALYQGELARSITTAVNNDINPGALSLQDMRAYRALEREALCKRVLGYNICGMGLPSSGAATVLGILGQMEVLLAEGKLSKGRTVSGYPETAHAFIEASRLAFADRNTWLADPGFVDVPLGGLLDNSYIEGRAARIDMSRRQQQVEPGLPEPNVATRYIPADGFAMPSTTHMSIVDAEGNIVSMTTSIESAFGSRLMTNGFLLNNQLTDFSFAPLGEDGSVVANRVEPGKRPLSSMSPIIIFNASNDPVMVIGSPGGRSIIPYVARVIYDHIVGGEDLYHAVAAKHVVETGRLVLETGTVPGFVEALQHKGHTPVLRDQSSGIHALHIAPDGWTGVADPRREGHVAAR